jgi:hypothetical protein
MDRCRARTEQGSGWRAPSRPSRGRSLGRRLGHDDDDPQIIEQADDAADDEGEHRRPQRGADAESQGVELRYKARRQRDSRERERANAPNRDLTPEWFTASILFGNRGMQRGHVSREA